jgi:hypothetical protein
MTVIILSLVLVVSVVLNVFLIKATHLAADKIDEYESWILKYQGIVKETYSMLKVVDEKEIFERDDEVGFVFSNIVSIVNDLKEKTYAETQEEIKKDQDAREESLKKREFTTSGRFPV